MSFPKAKLQRFNDVRDSLPSPADYNPKIQERNSNSVFAQSQRFAEHQRSSSCSDSFSMRSANSSECFRTPNISKKKKLVSSPRHNQTVANLFHTANDVEALQEKIVECNNKDLYINELTDHIDEMKLQMNNLQNKNELLIIENRNYEDKIEQLLKEYYNQLENLMQEINANQKIAKKKEQFKNIDDLDYLYKTIMKTYQEGLNKKNDDLKHIAASLSALKKAFLVNAENFKTLLSSNLRVVEGMFFKIITCLEKLEKVISANQDSKIAHLQQQLSQEKTKLQQEYEEGIRQMEENRNEVKTQMEEKCKNIEASWLQRLEQQEKEAEDILKECQVISEYNIIQCELEKNAVAHELIQVTEAMKNAKQEVEEIRHLKNQSDHTYQSLKADFDEMLADLNSLRKQLKEEKQSHETHLRQVESDKHMYEVTINKTRETIEALKKRLFDSDKDVELLKLELESTERSKLELEARCNRLSEDLEDLKKINDDLELQNESTIKIMQKKIEAIENDLLQKTELYRQTSEESIKRIKTEKNNEIQEIMEQLHRQQELNSTSEKLIEKARTEIENLEISNRKLELSVTMLQTEKQAEYQEKKNLEINLAKQRDENTSLQSQNEQLKIQNVDFELLMKQFDQLQEKSDSYYKYCEYYKGKAEDYEKEIEKLNSANKKCFEHSDKYEALMKDFEELIIKNSQLEKKVAEQESLIGPFREQLEAYELEYRNLMTRKCNAEAEAKAMGMKYAELMGHQNQKQKIKHIVDLKIKNSTLYETNIQLEQKVRAQMKTIEKLKKNLNGGKENKPNTNVNLNFTSSPLRERN